MFIEAVWDEEVNAIINNLKNAAPVHVESTADTLNGYWLLSIVLLSSLWIYNNLKVYFLLNWRLLTGFLLTKLM